MIKNIPIENLSIGVSDHGSTGKIYPMIGKRNIPTYR